MMMIIIIYINRNIVCERDDYVVDDDAYGSDDAASRARMCV